MAGNQVRTPYTGNGCLQEASGIQVFRLGPDSELYVGNINTRFIQAKLINFTLVCNKIPSGLILPNPNLQA